jgi:hypothetical protein
MEPIKTAEQNPTISHIPTGVPAPRGTPGVITRSGQRKSIVLIRSDALAPQLQRFLQAGIRRIEALLWIDGVMVTVVAAIVRRGRRLPVQLHPLGTAGQFLADLYNKRRAASGRRRSPVPVLVLSIAPLIEMEDQKPAVGGRP